MNIVGPDMPMAMIAAYSKRQAMDWSLVLASQDIGTTIVQSDNAAWGLLVEPQDHDRALEAIRQYRLENRRWAWRQPIPWSEAVFHWGSLGWCLLLILVHWITFDAWPVLRQAAQFDSALAARGQWWRAFTAILLHADLSHLLGNATIGFLLLGLAMARYGAGAGLCAAYLAGAAGNLAGLLLHPEPYHGMGASGMVLGALGLISIPPFRNWSFHPRAIRQLIQAVFASVMLFVLLGVDPASDVIAHLGGFVAGIVLGTALNLPPSKAIQSRSFAVVAWVLLGALLTVTTWLAIGHTGSSPGAVTK